MDVTDQTCLQSPFHKKEYYNLGECMPALHVGVGVGVCTILALTVAKSLRANF